MAGLFYLPRLFVYHTEQVEQGSATDLMFQTMERRLLRGIMGPASVATWLFGLALAFTPGIIDWSAVWPWTKAAAVSGMTWFHHWLMITAQGLHARNQQPDRARLPDHERSAHGSSAGDRLFGGAEVLNVDFRPVRA